MNDNTPWTPASWQCRIDGRLYTIRDTAAGDRPFQARAHAGEDVLTTEDLGRYPSREGAKNACTVHAQAHRPARVRVA